jgi:hypothetical protein
MAIKTEENAWVSAQRDAVRQYLEREGVRHGAIGEWPAWHVHPFLAIWAIESLAAPGRIGWWAITGDVPTDYVGSREASHPRDVMRHFATQWTEVSSSMLRGERHHDLAIGTPDRWPELGDLLQRRGQLLGQFADDDSIWEDEDT